MLLHTIGFAGRDARSFFTAVRAAGVDEVLDVRRHNTSQLAGYTKRKDLPYFLAELCGASYRHAQELAPGADLLVAYRAGELPWEDYATAYRAGLPRDALKLVAEEVAGRSVALLCSEHDAERCHRSLLATALRRRVKGLRVTHL